MKGVVFAVVLVITILAGAGGGYLAGNMVGRTAVPVSTTTATSTAIVEETTTMNFTTTVPGYSAPPFIYLTNSSLCTGGGSPAPCFGSPAYVFNACTDLLSGPPSPYTCTYTVKNSVQPPTSYKINITLGLTGQPNEPAWANCSWANGVEENYAACVSVINSTAFIMGIQSPPPL